MNDQSLADTGAADAAANVDDLTQLPEEDLILTLEEVLNESRRIELTATIYLREDLQAEFNQVLEELSELVDEHGQMLNEDAPLAEVGRAQKLSARANELYVEMRKSKRTVRFRGMVDEDFRSFDESHRKDGKVKDPEAYDNEIIARCAIAPEMTVADVRKMRQRLGRTQMNTLSLTALKTCTAMGVDVPKSLPSLAAQEDEKSSPS